MKKIITLAIFVLTAVSITACNGPKKDEAVAIVNNTKITAGQYEKNLALYKESFEAGYGKEIWEKEVEKGVKYKDKFKEQILDQMVGSQAVYEKLKKENKLPSNNEIEESFKQLKEVANSDENQKKLFERLGISDDFLKNQQTKDLTFKKYEESFTKEVNISEEEMNSYYAKNRDTLEKVKASHILIKMLDKNNKPMSDKDKEKAKKKAEELLKKLKKGEDFAKIAKESSEDTGSAVNNGDLGFFTKEKMVKPFSDAAFKLNKDEISDIVESEFGYHIIKVTDKKISYEDLKDEIRETIVMDKFSKNVEELTKSFKAEKNMEVLKKIKF